MSDIPRIGPAEPKINHELVAMLKDMVKRAEEGEIISFAGVAELTGKEVLFARSSSTDSCFIIGALSLLQRKMELLWHEQWREPR